MHDPAFIPELLRAANEADKLTRPEVSRLLKRAAATIRDLRALVAVSGRQAAEKTDIAFQLDELSKIVDRSPSADISRALLDAADTMRTLRILLGIKQEIESES